MKMIKKNKLIGLFILLVLVAVAGVAVVSAAGEISAFTVTPDPIKLGSPAAINYTLAQAGKVTIKVLDEAGVTEIRTLASNVSKAAGSYSQSWDGKASLNGALVPDASYTIKLELRDTANNLLADAKQIVKAYSAPTLKMLSGSPLSTGFFDPGDPLALYKQAKVSYSLSRSAVVTVNVLKGTVPIKTTTETKTAGGTYDAIWDGTDNSGVNYVADGPYIIQIDAANPDNSAFKSIPIKYTVTLDKNAPQVSAFATSSGLLKFGTPVTLKANLNEKAYVTLEIKNDVGTVVKTLLNNALKMPGLVSATWDGKDKNLVNVPEGKYTAVISAVDIAKKTAAAVPPVAIETAYQPVVTGLPVATATTKLPYFNPNSGSITVNYNLSNIAKAAAKADVTVQILKGTTIIKNYLPQTLDTGDQYVIWDGKNGNTVLPDGTYTIQVTAASNQNPALKTTAKGNVDIEAAAPSIDGLTLAPNPLKLGAATLTAKFNLSENSKVSLSIFQGTNTICEVLKDNAKIAGVVTLTWNGKAGTPLALVPEGTYTAKVKVVDNYGNTAEASGDFKAAYFPTISKVSVLSHFDPFTGDPINIGFDVSSKAKVKVSILNGISVINNVYDVVAGPGTLNCSWDGTNTSGTVMPDGAYSYQIEAISEIEPTFKSLLKGNIILEGRDPSVSSISVTPLPVKTNAPATFKYYLSEPGTVALQILTADDQAVRTNLPSDVKSIAGTYTKIWDGKNGSGLYVPAGSYKAVFTATDKSLKTASFTYPFTVAAPNVILPITISGSITPASVDMDALKTATISYTVSADSTVTAVILDSTGKTYRALYYAKPILANAAEVIVWDGTGGVPSGLKPGKYTLKIDAIPQDPTKFIKATKSMIVNLVGYGTTCATCHTGYPAAHQQVTKDNCTLCHGETKPIYRIDQKANCYPCHNQSTNHFTIIESAKSHLPSSWNPTYCLGCHSKGNTYGVKSVHTGIPNHSVNVYTTDAARASSCVYCHATKDLEALHVGVVNKKTSQTMTCNSCHGTAADPVVKAVIAAPTPANECASCHNTNAKAAGIGPVHADAAHAPADFTTADYNGTDKATCKLCHTSKSLVAIHTGTTAAGKAMNCDTCHASTAANVKSAITAKNDNCNACHDLNTHFDKRARTVAQHSSTFLAVPDGDCSVCHAGGSDSLPVEHFKSSSTINGTSTPITCDGCHASTDPKVQTAITGNNTMCNACHIYPPTLHNPTHAVSVYTTDTARTENCATCHTTKDIEVIHVNVLNKKTNQVMNCGTCHNATAEEVVKAAITAGVTNECATCHSASATAPGLKPVHAAVSHSPADFTTAAYTTTDKGTCKLCHTTMRLDTIHTGTTAAGKTMNCDTCHGTAAATNVKTAVTTKNDNCNACHTLTGHFDKRAKTVTQHSSDFMLNQEVECASCHAGGSDSLPVEHFKTTSTVNGTTTKITCDTCHLSTDQKVIDAIAANNSRCDACHTYPPALHNPAHTVNVYTVDTASAGTCVSCHASKDIKTIHVNVLNKKTNQTMTCNSCHGAAADPIVKAAITAGVSNECATCHKAGATTTGLKPVHSSVVHAPADYTTSAYTGTDKATCVLCHTTKRLDLLHTGTAVQSGKAMNCDTCHGATAAANVKAAVTAKNDNCIACHDLSTHFDKRARTVTNHTSNFMAVPEIDCSACHIGGSDALPLEHFKAGSTVNGGPGPFTCDSCHASTDPLVQLAVSSNNTDCDACHAYPPVLHQPNHTVVQYNTDPARTENCASCHTTQDIKVIHVNVLNKKTNKNMTCNSCHGPAADPVVKAAITAGAASKECATCHNTSATTAGLKPVHSDLNAAHTGPALATTPTNCAKCHSNIVTTEHSGGAVLKHNATLNCNSCHMSTKAKVTAAISSAVTDGSNLKCAACHSGTTDGVEAVHANVYAPHISGIFPNTTDAQCLDCHTTLKTAFSSTNESYHTVNGLLYKTSGYGGYLTYEGVIWTSKSSMKCTSCHGANATAHILKAPFSSNTGSTTATANDLCFKCHDRGTYVTGTNKNTGFRTGTNGTNLHTLGDHKGSSIKCVSCHTFAPHGGGWRLLGTTKDTSAPFAKMANNIRIDRATNKYTKDSCATNCGEHSSR